MPRQLSKDDIEGFEQEEEEDLPVFNAAKNNRNVRPIHISNCSIVNCNEL